MIFVERRCRIGLVVWWPWVVLVIFPHKWILRKTRMGTPTQFCHRIPSCLSVDICSRLHGLLQWQSSVDSLHHNTQSIWGPLHVSTRNSSAVSLCARHSCQQVIYEPGSDFLGRAPAHLTVYLHYSGGLFSAYFALQLFDQCTLHYAFWSQWILELNHWSYSVLLHWSFLTIVLHAL